MPEQVSGWTAAGWAAAATALSTILGWLPRLLGAVVVLLVGWGIASLLGRLTGRALDAIHFDDWMARARVNEAIQRTGMRVGPSELIGGLVKWGVFLVAILVAADALGLQQVTAALNAVLGYIPNVIAAVLILGFGAVLASFLGNVVLATGLAASRLLSQVAYWAIIGFAALAALSQLNIAPELVQTLFTAIMGSAALAAAIAFGLGLRHQAEDLGVSAALRTFCKEGDRISVAGLDGQQVAGTVQTIGPGMTTLRTETGAMLVPNRLLGDHVVTLMGGTGEPKLRVSRMPETAEVAEETASRPGGIA